MERKYLDRIERIDFSDGSVEHYKKGKLHNENGPAVIRSDGTEVYYLEGNKLTKEEWQYKIMMGEREYTAKYKNDNNCA